MVSDVLMICLMPLYFFVIFTFHEYGHYVLARLCRVKIDAVSVGIGKVIKRGTLRNGISWTLRRFPLSGRVTLNQESFESLSFSKKVSVIMAGPVFNVILALLIMFPIYAVIGQPSQPPVFTAVKVGSVADQAGFRVDDRILRVNGLSVERYEQVSEISKVIPVSEIDLTIERGGDVFDVTVTPLDDRYIDIKGVERREGMLGVFAKHVPIDLESVFSVNGVKVNEIDHARTLVMEQFGYPITLGIETSDNRDSEYKTIIYSSVNAHLFDPNHKRYEEIYLGSIRDNFYRDLSVVGAFYLALSTTKKMFLDVVSLPAQIFPIDGRKVKPETKVYDDATPIRNFVFRAGFFIGVISIFIGFVNLIPLPHFDGGQLLLLAAQKLKKEPLTRKQRARIIVVALVSLYLSVMLMNMKKLPLYIDAKIENLQEFIEDL